MDNEQIDNGHEQASQQQKGIDEEQAFNDAQMASLAEVKKRRKAIEHDANLLANRIALLKQEEMKTWKKIEDTRKRTNEITSLKNRNEERIRQVSLFQGLLLIIERKRDAGEGGIGAILIYPELHGSEAASRGKA